MQDDQACWVGLCVESLCKNGGAVSVQIDGNHVSCLFKGLMQSLCFI